MAETIGAYLVRRLAEEGVDHIFGVPGDYCLTLFSLLEKSPIRVVNTSDEQGAGFAADAYARIRGSGRMRVTYCVGGLKVANTTAQAYAEKSPLVIISGAPGIPNGEESRCSTTGCAIRHPIKCLFRTHGGAAVLDDPQRRSKQIERMFAPASVTAARSISNCRET